MSDDTLLQLMADTVADVIKKHAAKVVYAAWAGLVAIVTGTAWIVAMVYDVRGSIREAHREAALAREALVDLRATVTGHERSITVLNSWMKWKGGGE